jgi:Fe-Mn family superoxide dismutase
MEKLLLELRQLKRELLVYEHKKFFINEMKKIGIDKLPYAYTSLKKFIDPETMNVHYNKHYKGYVEKLNLALSEKNVDDVKLEDIVKNIKKYDDNIRNNAGGAFNHALFWKMLSPTEKKPGSIILKAIEKEFGSLGELKKVFNAEAKSKFGSGWVWLIINDDKKLKIVTTTNQDNPLMDTSEEQGYPLLGLDLWEHAYYLKYKNRRDMYIKNFWKVVDWDFVEDVFLLKTGQKVNENYRRPSDIRNRRRKIIIY